MKNIRKLEKGKIFRCHSKAPTFTNRIYFNVALLYQFDEIIKRTRNKNKRQDKSF